MSFDGFTSPSAFGGLSPDTVLLQSTSPRRNIGGIFPNVTIEEQGNDQLVVTSHPVERGAQISDHCYKQPAALIMRVGFSNASEEAGGDPNYVTDVYNTFLAMQVSGELLDVVTGKRFYTNMLITSLDYDNDQTTETSLFLVVGMAELIIVQTTPTSVPPVQNQKSPEQTAPVEEVGIQQLRPAVVDSLRY